MGLKWLLYLIGFGIFGYILNTINLTELLSVLARSDIILIFLAWSLTILVVLLKSLRWNLINRISGINLRNREAVLIYGSGLYFGVITPGRLGEFVKYLYLKAKGNSPGKVLSTVFMDRVFDIIFLVVFFLGSVLFFLESLDLIPFVILVAIVIILGAFFMVFKKHFTGFFTRFVKFIAPKKYATSDIDKHISEFFDFSAYRNLRNMIKISFYTVFAWIVYFFQVYLFSLALNQSIPLSLLIGAVTIAIFVSMLPITISGIGTRDAVLVITLTTVSPESSVALSFLILSMSLIVAVIGFTCWLIKPINIKRNDY